RGRAGVAAAVDGPAQAGPSSALGGAMYRTGAEGLSLGARRTGGIGAGPNTLDCSASWFTRVTVVARDPGGRCPSRGQGPRSRTAAIMRGNGRRGQGNPIRPRAVGPFYGVHARLRVTFQLVG